MSASQIRGLIAIFLFLAFIPLFSLYSNYFQNLKPPVFTEEHKNTIAIEITGKETGNGIYFVESGATANQLFSLIGCDFKPEKDLQLKNAMKLTVVSKSSKKVSVSSIDNASRLALGIPIDLNNATEEDLLMISGIGEATAQKILDLRNKKVRFQRIEELMEIKGIKEKRLDKLRKYFFLE